MNITFSESSPRVTGVRPQDNFAYSIVETPLIVSGSTAAGADLYDATTLVTSGAGIKNNCIIDVSDSATIPGHTLTSLTPDVCSVDVDGAIAWVADGECRIAIDTPVGQKIYTRTMSDTASAITVVDAYKSGSLAKKISDDTDALIAGKTASATTQQLWSSVDYSAGTGTRNTSNIAAALDLSPISLSNSSKFYFPGLLISPRHIVGAGHAQAGSPITFKRADGTYQTVTVVSANKTGNHDLSVAYLSAAITGITPFKLMPSNWKDYLKSLDGQSARGKVPVIIRVAHNNSGAFSDQISIGELYALSAGFDSTRFVSINMPTDSPRYSWHTPASGGDSGAPIMLLVNGALILIAARYSVGGGYALADQAAEIKARMLALAVAQGDNTAYDLTYCDLSGFTAY